MGMEKYERDLSVCESTLSRELSHGMFSTSSPSICFDRDHDLLADNELLARDVVSSTKFFQAIRRRDLSFSHPQSVMPQLEAKKSTSRRKWASREDWDLRRATITRLYSKENMTLKLLMVVMEEKYNFIATAKMYKDRFKIWGIKKNLKGSVADVIFDVKTQREAAGKSSRFIRLGTEIDYSLVLRHQRRNRQTSREKIPTGSSTLELEGIRVITPPPQLRAPDSVQAPEHILWTLRDYIDGKFDNETWTFDQSSVEISNKMLEGTHTYGFFELFIIGRDCFCHMGRTSEGRRLLNLAFTKLKLELRIEEPCFLVRLLGLFSQTKVFQMGNVMAKIDTMLWNYLQELSRYILVPEHPFSRTWHIIRNSIVFAEQHGQSELVVQFIAEQLGRHVGPSTFDVIWISAKLCDIPLEWSMEEPGCGRREQMIRDLLHSREHLKGSKKNIELQSRISLSLVYNLCQQDRITEAREVVDAIINKQRVHFTTKADCLIMKARLEARAGDLPVDACTALFEDAMRLVTTEWVADSIPGLVRLWLIRRELEALGYETGASQIQEEIDKRLGAIEREHCLDS